MAEPQKLLQVLASPGEALWQLPGTTLALAESDWEVEQLICTSPAFAESKHQSDRLEALRAANQTAGLADPVVISPNEPIKTGIGA